ncbi:hypothetical protein JCM8097_005800 [Rhodosporidiobolus ruineniae]
MRGAGGGLVAGSLGGYQSDTNSFSSFVEVDDDGHLSSASTSTFDARSSAPSSAFGSANPTEDEAGDEDEDDEIEYVD